MANAVNYTTDDLHREVAALHMECKVRAQREDALVKRIAELEAEILASQKIEEKAGGE